MLLLWGKTFFFLSVGLFCLRRSGIVISLKKEIINTFNLVWLHDNDANTKIPIFEWLHYLFHQKLKTRPHKHFISDGTATYAHNRHVFSAHVIREMLVSDSIHYRVAMYGHISLVWCWTLIMVLCLCPILTALRAPRESPV